MTLQATRPKPPSSATRKLNHWERCAGFHEQARKVRQRHWAWLLAGFPFAFAVPFLLADTARSEPRSLLRPLRAGRRGLRRGLGARHTAHPSGLHAQLALGLVLGAAGAAVMAFIVLRTEDATARPGGIELAAAVLWRGVLYGVTDGVLLSVFPILAVFAAFAGTRLRQRVAGKVLIGTIAMVASIGITAVVPPGVLGLPVGEGAEADRGRHGLERAHAPDPEPARSADRTRRPARERRPAQLRDRHVPSPARLRAGTGESVVSTAVESRSPPMPGRRFYANLRLG